MNVLLFISCLHIFTHMVIVGKNINAGPYKNIKISKQDSNEKDIQEHTGKINLDTTTESKKQKLEKQVARFILEGAVKEVQKAPLEDLIRTMESLRPTGVIPKCTTNIWTRMKREKGVDNFTSMDAAKWQELIKYLHKKDLAILVENSYMRTYFGRLKDLDNQDLAIFKSYADKKNNEDIYKNRKNIHRLYGLICGQPQAVSSSITDEKFARINVNALRSLHSCSLTRVRWMLERMMEPTIFGPPQGWNATIISNLNMLLLALLPEELISIRPAAMEKMSSGLIEEMDIELIRSFSKKQLSHLSRDALFAYKKKLSNKQVFHKSNFEFLVMLLLTQLLPYCYN